MKKKYRVVISKTTGKKFCLNFGKSVSVEDLIKIAWKEYPEIQSRDLLVSVIGDTIDVIPYWLDIERPLH